MSNIIIAGTRGWSKAEEGDNQKLIKREVSRLELSIQQGIKIINSEEVLYNELDLEIARDLLQQFLTDNNLSQESFNTLANFYKEQEPPNTVINPNRPDPRKKKGAINARNDYETLFT